MKKLRKLTQTITIEIKAKDRFAMGNMMIDVRKFINSHNGTKKIKESNVKEEIILIK